MMLSNAIKSYIFICYIISITFLGKQGILVSNSLSVIENTQNKLSELKCVKGKTLTRKLDVVLNKNSCLKIVSKISKILKSEVEDMEGCMKS